MDGQQRVRQSLSICQQPTNQPTELASTLCARPSQVDIKSLVEKVSKAACNAFDLRKIARSDRFSRTPVFFWGEAAWLTIEGNLNESSACGL